jgi:NADPH:quinone reductase-like Zn-dependent oxidoreductase
MPSAVILEETDASVKFHNAKLVKVPRPVPKVNEALIKVEAVALNHRELWIIDNNYPVMMLSCTIALAA